MQARVAFSHRRVLVFGRVSECGGELRERWTGRRRELPARSFAFASVSGPRHSRDEFRARVWAGVGTPIPNPLAANRTHP